ncbi:MAG: ABC transporter permease subunit, partial [Clostridia bacterium]|nr:ABC transporter permease subunit [Clostridia bacterium]
MQNYILANVFTQIGKIFSTQKYMKYVWRGLGNTVYISICAALIGIFLGTLVALVKIQPKSKAWTVPKIICEAYTTIIRGTPMALQLFIMAFAVFAIRGFPLAITAIIAFGINSGAYVSENISAGILSVDKGLTEA